MTDDASLAAKAEYYLMLARAFLPPTQADAHKAFTAILPEELGEIARTAGYASGAVLADYERAAQDIPDATALLQLYSGLFLTPPREIQLYVSVYLDGTILGRSADALEVFYRKHGLARSEDFRDLPDHLSAVLEFLALLYASAAETAGFARAELLNDARDLNHHFLLSWIPVMRRQTEKTLAAHGQNRLYLELMELLQQALVADAEPLTEGLQKIVDGTVEARSDHEESKDMALCRSCGTEIAPAARIRRVRKVLEREGIDASHLDLCPKCRGFDLGMPG